MTDTAKKIKQAVVRIEKGRPKIVGSDRKLSITSVAEEAGIHRSTIINRHPLLADEINKKTGLGTQQNESKEKKILELERKLVEANNKIAELEALLSKAISIQASNVLGK